MKLLKTVDLAVAVSLLATTVAR